MCYIIAQKIEYFKNNELNTFLKILTIIFTFFRKYSKVIFKELGKINDNPLHYSENRREIMKEQIKTLLNLNAKINRGDKKRIEKQHKLEKLTARERIDILLDESSFIEIDKFMGEGTFNQDNLSHRESADSVVVGYGTIDGRLLFVYSQDFTVNSGAMGEKHAKKILKIQDMALKMGAPIVGFIDSSGGKIEEGLDTLSGYGKILRKSSILSGVVPQISVVVGPCIGGAAYSPALSDFVFMVNGTSHMSLNGPQVLGSTESEEIDIEKLGGAMTHSKTSGIAHFIDDSEEGSIDSVRRLLSYLPSNYLEDVPRYDFMDDINRVDNKLNEIIPEEYHKSYDVKDIINSLADSGEFFEISSHYAPNIVVGYIRLNGSTIGVVANQSDVLDGVLDIKAVNKATRFIRICDSFNIPILNLVDTPGFLLDKEQEYEGVIKHGARMIYAYSEATVPKVTVVLRRAYGSAYLAMCPKDLGADQVFALPIAEISVINPEGAANIVFKEEIANAEDPISVRQEKIIEYRDTVANPYTAARNGYVDDIIVPSLLRPRLIYSFDMLATKVENRTSKKQGNLPI